MKKSMKKYLGEIPGEEYLISLGEPPRDEYFVAQVDTVYCGAGCDDEMTEFWEDYAYAIFPEYIYGFDSEEEMEEFISNPPSWINPENGELWMFTNCEDLEKYHGLHRVMV